MNSIRLDKRDLILAKGSLAMTRCGYHGTGVQDIVQAAGIPKGSFYHYFESKEDFALQALEHLYGPRLARYAEALGNPVLGPRARILTYYRELLAHFSRQEKLEFHCFIGSLSFEMAELSPAITERVDGILQQSIDILRDCLADAQRAGELPAAENVEQLAEFIGNAWQGVLARLKVSASLKPLERFIERLEYLLQA
ncbi:TetR/AcrR family transcriptional regulator [Pseudomonas sp. 30_B]|uniref:TetR/AcrR family transcriptional regulator n=1 Tax=Pseudomonas sp. 30_B TaxID=2813575 RepID=UPI001A9FDA48|nr:TetR/AcrR family transcriptional regulator [Pseudomonas sp. 30_B]